MALNLQSEPSEELTSVMKNAFDEIYVKWGLFCGADWFQFKWRPTLYLTESFAWSESMSAAIIGICMSDV